jgi:putative hemolysin
MVELFIVILLIIANGLFAMAEMAIVSARKARLEQWVNEGDGRAQTALDLAQSPGRFLSTVQIGITLVGVLTGALGGATIAAGLSAWLARVPLLEPYSKPLSMAIVVVGITYLSLVIGELLPKRIALSNAGRIASLVAPPMTTLARLASPLVSLLDNSTRLALRVLGITPSSEPPITEEEVKILIQKGTQVGVFEPMEEEMVEQVFRLADRQVSALITPRSEVAWLQLDDDPDEICRTVRVSGYSRFPVARDSLDDVCGVVLAKDLLAQSLDCESTDLEPILRPPLFVPETLSVLAVVERFKEARSKIAIVIDEYGIVQGIVTVDDILDAIIGVIPETDDHFDPEILQRQDGSWLMDGMVLVDEFMEHFEIRDYTESETWSYQTLGGFVMMQLGRIPSAGDHFEWQNLRVEVMDMDGHRVDKVLVTQETEMP